METLTNTKLANITDEGLFERVATAVLRLVPEYEGLAHAGINADGKTRKSPVDGLGFSGENGSRMILAQHTITAAAGLNVNGCSILRTCNPVRAAKRSRLLPAML